MHMLERFKRNKNKQLATPEQVSPYVDKETLPYLEVDGSNPELVQDLDRVRQSVLQLAENALAFNTPDVITGDSASDRVNSQREVTLDHGDDILAVISAKYREQFVGEMTTIAGQIDGLHIAARVSRDQDGYMGIGDLGITEVAISSSPIDLEAMKQDEIDAVVAYIKIQETGDTRWVKTLPGVDPEVTLGSIDSVFAATGAALSQMNARTK